MNASIEGRDSEGCGLEVVDNNGVEHWIELKYGPGNISYHEQEGYPDEPDARTWEENEHVAQARWYARYYVYRQTEYDTLPGYRNPDRATATLMTLWQMPAEDVAQLFETFSQQSRSYYEDVTRPVALGPDVDPDQVNYRQNIYLDADITEIRGSVNTFVETLAGTAVDALNSVSLDIDLSQGPLESTVDAVAGAIETEREEYDFPQYEVAGTSDLYYLYYAGFNQPETVTRSDPFNFERKPDARLELPPLHPGFLDQLKPFLIRHFVCQVRDIYISMGTEPPAPFRVLGLGKHTPTQRYQHSDMYENYFDFDADIPGYHS